MLKYLIPAALALTAATPAFAQNDMDPAAGKNTGWKDAPVSTSRAVTFTAAGTYADQTALRLIDVAADIDGDGTPDSGLLRVACNGGDVLSGVFVPGGSVATVTGKKPKLIKAAAGSALASGKAVKARWNAGGAGTDKPVTLAADQGAVCAGLG